MTIKNIPPVSLSEDGDMFFVRFYEGPDGHCGHGGVFDWWARGF